MTIKKGDVLTYIGHTDACKENCGAPCCPPGTGCPWEEMVGHRLTVTGDVDEFGTFEVQFEGEERKNFLKYHAHVSSASPTK